jgi:hypothetical protein
MLISAKRALVAAAMCLPVIAAVAVQAGADDATEARLREALRTTTEQLHRLEADNAALQAKQSSVKAPTADGKADNSRAVRDLKRRLAAAEQDAATAKAAQVEAVAAAQKKEAENAQTIAGLTADKDRFAACRSKNEALLKIGYELLDRYENAGIGEMLGRKEPFTGIKRVALQNIEQETRDQLRGNTVKP